MNYFSSLRLCASSVQNVAFSRQVLSMLKAYPHAFDDVWLGTLLSLPPLEEHALMAKKNGEFAKKLRQLGVSVSLQILESVGHRGCGIDSFAGFNWDLMVNCDGSTCSHVGCLRSPAFWHYEQEMVALYLEQIHPDRLWVDDDVRLYNHGPLRYGCFCPNCLKQFSEKTGRDWTREKLADELFMREGPSPVRLAWSEFNQESIGQFIRAISEKAAEVQPGIQVGIQCAELSNLYNGNDFGGVLEAIQQATRRSPCIRPGGWTYTDYDPRWIVDKVFFLGMTAHAAKAACPTAMACAEIENYPRTALGKTPYGTVLEGALDLALGCDSLSYFLNAHQDFTDACWKRYARRISDWQPFFQIIRSSGKTRNGGLNAVRSREHCSNAPKNSCFSLPSNEAIELFHSGLPVTMDDSLSGLSPSLIIGAAALGFSRRDVEKYILSNDAMMSGEAFHILQQKGLLEELGIRAVPLAEDAQCGEKLTDDPLNGAFAGSFYYNPQTNAPACIFDLGLSGARSLGVARRHLQDADYGCTSFVLEHHSGKRLAVCGLPGKFSREVSEGKFFQLVRLSDWIQRGTCPVLPRTPHSQILIPLFDGKKLKGVVVLNNTIEPVSLTLELRTDSRETPVWNRPEHAPRPLKPIRPASGNSVIVRLPKLPGWEIGFISL